MFIKRCLIMVVISALVLPLCVFGTSALSRDDVTSPSVLLMEPNTKKILFEKNSDEQRACASITKVMTLLLVMEAIEQGKIDYDDDVTASAHAASMGGSDIWLEEGEQMSVDDMIKATAVASANDAAVALAEFICGSESDFVALMNSRAKELGMENTVFKNCNGLDEEGHLTTAYDVALMSAELIKHEKIFDYTTIWLDYLRAGETQIVNTNKLLRSYDGITGLKTGTTSDAGSCITATAVRNGMSLIAVVLGSSTGTERFKDAATLLDYGFANFEILSFDAQENNLTDIKVENGMHSSVKVQCDGEMTMIVDKGSSGNVQQSVDISESVEAPVRKGQKVGTLTYTLNDNKVSQFDIVASHDVEKISFSAVFFELVSALVVL